VIEVSEAVDCSPEASWTWLQCGSERIGKKDFKLIGKKKQSSTIADIVRIPG